MTKSETYIQFILDLINGGIVERGKVMAKVGKKWQLPPRTFDRYWKKAQEQHAINQQAINELKAKEYTTQQLEAVKSQIKSKNERLAILQSQVDDLLSKIEANQYSELRVVAGSVKKISREYTVLEYTQLQRNLHLLQSEISKIEGDYAAVKQEVNAKVEAIKVIRE